MIRIYVLGLFFLATHVVYLDEPCVKMGEELD